LTTHIQTITEDHLITRQKRAIGALMVHGSGIIIVYLWAGSLILTQAAHPIQLMFFISSPTTSLYASPVCSPALQREVF
jgi:hypothetical protein